MNHYSGRMQNWSLSKNEDYNSGPNTANLYAQLRSERYAYYGTARQHLDNKSYKAYGTYLNKALIFIERMELLELYMKIEFIKGED